MNVFVYGSLKMGCENHYLLEKEFVAFVGEGYVKGYSLYDVLSTVCMIESENENDIVYGEVYDVSPKDIKAIDYFEDEGSVFSRSFIKGVINDKEIGVYTYLYLKDVDKSKKINCIESQKVKRK